VELLHLPRRRRDPAGTTPRRDTPHHSGRSHGCDCDARCNQRPWHSRAEDRFFAVGSDSTRGASPIGHMIFQVLVLTPLVFLGLVAFVRCLEIAIDDWEFVTRITRLRRTYDQLVPELAPLMSRAVADEGTAAMLSPRWQPFQKMLSVAGSVAVITSVVLGGDAGVIVFGVSRMLYLAIALGTAAGALALGWATWYQWRHWCQASPPSSREVTPA